MEDTTVEYAGFTESRVAILGEGVAALILALRFAQAGRTVTLVGRFSSPARGRPLALRANDRNAMRMLDELGLLDAIAWNCRMQAFHRLGVRTDGAIPDGHARLSHALRDRLIALKAVFRPTIEGLDVDEIVAAPLAVTDLETAVVLATSAYRARCADQIA